MGGTRHCLLVGVNAYDDEGIRNLQGCCNDVKALKEAYSTSTNTNTNAVLLSDDSGIQPTAGNIIRQLHNMCEASQPGDVVILHFSCHGASISNRLYLLPRDAVGREIEAVSVKFSRVLDTLDRRCKARRRLVTIDACESGTLRSIASVKSAVANDLDRREADGRFITVCISACSYNEVAGEGKEGGVFTSCLAAGISGNKACNSSGFVDIVSLFNYIELGMRNTAQKPNCKLHTNMPIEASTFAISHLRKDQDSEILTTLVSEDAVLYGTLCAMSHEFSTANIGFEDLCIEAVVGSHVVFVDVRDMGLWDSTRLFIERVRRDKRSSCIAFILVGYGPQFLESIQASHKERYSHYFFVDLRAPYYLMVDNTIHLVRTSFMFFKSGTFSSPNWLSNTQRAINSLIH
jgi:hypothetical protein